MQNTSRKIHLRLRAAIVVVIVVFVAVVVAVAALIHIFRSLDMINYDGDFNVAGARTSNGGIVGPSSFMRFVGIIGKVRSTGNHIEIGNT